MKIKKNKQGCLAASLPGWMKWALFYVFICFAAFYASSNFLQLILIQGDSMYPAYRNMQPAVLDKYHKDYACGDVIAFFCEELHAVLVKRIAAVSGDTVQITDGTLYVNGAVSAVYPQKGIFAYSGTASEPVRLKAGQYFVIGDNTAQSKDSRYAVVGVVCMEQVIGKVM